MLSSRALCAPTLATA